MSVHLPKGFFIQKGGFEYTLALAAGALAVAFTGPGAMSADAALGIDWSGPFRHGKGNKARLIPVGESAIYALDRWRELAPRGGSRKAIFLNFRDGQRLTSRGAQLVVKDRAVQAGIHATEDEIDRLAMADETGQPEPEPQTQFRKILGWEDME